MKYLTTILLLLTLTVQVQAQELSEERVLQFITNEVSDEVGGFEEPATSWFEDQEMVDKVKVVKVPDYYDSELMIMKINSLVRRYSDISYGMRWTREDNSLASSLILDDFPRAVIFVYMINHNVMLISLVE